jgi:hypothetical protein
MASTWPRPTESRARLELVVDQLASFGEELLARVDVQLLVLEDGLVEREHEDAAPSVRRTAAKLDAAIFWKIVITKPSARPWLPWRWASAKPSSRYSLSAA